MKKLSLPMAALALAAAPALGQTYDNGGMNPQAGGCNGGMHSDIEAPSSVYGNNTIVTSFHQADDFIVPGDLPEGASPTTMKWYLYQTSSSPQEPITAVFIRLWRGSQADMLAGAGTLVGGDMTTNRYLGQTFSNIYRTTVSAPADCNRAIKEVDVDMSWIGALSAGQYWIEVGSTGNPGFAGPWANHVVPRDGQENSIFYTVSTNAWGLNASNGVGWDYPYKLNYTGGGGGFDISLSGPCPGSKTLSWTGAGSGQMGIIVGNSQGSTTLPPGPCQGTVLGIQGGLLLYNVIGTQGGAGQVTGSVGQGACGKFVQCINTGTCATSDVAGPI